MQDHPIVRIRVRGAHGCLYRAGHVTPYFAETVLADLRRRGPGRVEVIVRGDPESLTTLRAHLRTLDTPTIRIIYRHTATPGGVAA